jgi:hypothetical protein
MEIFIGKFVFPSRGSLKQVMANSFKYEAGKENQK